MSSKAAPRKAGAIFATALALASLFNTGASAEDFRVRGNFSAPTKVDDYGIELPGCITGNLQIVKFVPRQQESFAGKDDSLFDYEFSHGVRLNEGPTVFYNYKALQAMTPPVRNFMLYQACLLNYYSDQGLRAPINTTDYTLSEIKADCSAAVILREEKHMTGSDINSLIDFLDVGKRTNPDLATPKGMRRYRNVTQCYFYNKMVENLNPPKPGRG